MTLTNYLSARRVKPKSWEELPEIIFDSEELTEELKKELVCLDESFIKPGGVKAVPRPAMATLNLANRLFQLYNETESRLTAVPNDMRPLWSDVLNHVKLSYEMIRKQYPNTFREL
jgi:hypothetical protein